MATTPAAYFVQRKFQSEASDLLEQFSKRNREEVFAPIHKGGVWAFPSLFW